MELIFHKELIFQNIYDYIFFIIDCGFLNYSKL